MFEFVRLHHDPLNKLYLVWFKLSALLDACEEQLELICILEVLTLLAIEFIELLVVQIVLLKGHL